VRMKRDLSVEVRAMFGHERRVNAVGVMKINGMSHLSQHFFSFLHEKL
jgi:hypothetical protein